MSTAIIVARGGSTRIPRKNIIKFMGRPMLSYAIGTARDSGLFDRILVSTEDTEIMCIAGAYGATTLARPAELATNEVGTQSVMQHAVTSLAIPDMDPVCCIYPCVPMLTPDDLRQAHKNLLLHSYIVAVAPEPLRDIGWFYFGRAISFASGLPLYSSTTGLHVIEESRAIDINVPEDLATAERMYTALAKHAA